MASGPMTLAGRTAASIGTPTHLGQIVATTTKNNHDTAVPFNNTGEALGFKVLLIQASAACHIRPVTSNAGTVTTANGIKLGTDEKVTLYMGSYTHLAVVGAATCVVWEMK